MPLLDDLGHALGQADAVLQADAQRYPFDAGAFDVAVSRTTAMFFGDQMAAFSNIGRGLRSGGRLV